MMTPIPRNVMLPGAMLVLAVVYLMKARMFPSTGAPASTSTDPVIARLQEYLRLRTDHDSPDYDGAIAFLNQTLATLLPTATIAVHTFVPGKPVLLATLPATHPDEPALLLNSHTDVVPAQPEHWSVDPFSASLVMHDGELRLYGRGSQDMKSVGLQYVEALSRLSAKGTWQPRRPIILSFVPDEEIGGVNGMKAFVNSPIYPTLNVGVALDEGLPNPDATFNVYYGERQTGWLHISVDGEPAHGATMPDETAVQILHEIMGRALEFRLEQFAELQTGKDIGEVVNVNLVVLNAGTRADSVPGGFAMNVVPSSAMAGFDIRVPPSVSSATIDAEIERWVTCDDGQRCPGVSLRWLLKPEIPVTTSRDPTENAFIVPFAAGLRKAGIVDRLFHGIFFGATDSRYLRNASVPCFGFSPIEQTPNLLHKHDEYITVQGYKAGIEIYEKIIKELADFAPSGEGIVEWASDGVVKVADEGDGALDDGEKGDEDEGDEAFSDSEDNDDMPQWDGDSDDDGDDDAEGEPANTYEEKEDL